MKTVYLAFLLASIAAAHADAGRRHIQGPLRMKIESENGQSWHNAGQRMVKHKLSRVHHAGHGELGFRAKIGAAIDGKRHQRRYPQQHQHPTWQGTSTSSASSSHYTAATTTYSSPAFTSTSTYTPTARPVATSTESSSDDDGSCEEEPTDSSEDDGGCDSSDTDSTEAATLAQATTSYSSNTATATGSTGSTFVGEATWYTQNGVAGACGTVAQDSDKVVALFTGIYSNGANCGRTIAITNTENGASVTATVRDECPSCSDNSHIDLSQGAFDALGSESQGVLNIKWAFTS